MIYKMVSSCRILNVSLYYGLLEQNTAIVKERIYLCVLKNEHIVMYI